MRDMKTLLRQFDVESKAGLNHLRQLERCSAALIELFRELEKVPGSEFTAAQVEQLKTSGALLARMNVAIAALNDEKGE